MRRLLKHTRLILGLVVVAGIIVMAMWPESLTVDVVTVVRGPLQVTIDEEGETRVRDRFIVSAPVGGRLQRIELEPGDAVVRGRTVVARLTSADSPLLDTRTRGELAAAVEAARATVGQARAERERALAALARATSSLARQDDLSRAGLLAKDTLEAAQTLLRTSDEAVRAADFTITRAEYDLQLVQARLEAPLASGRAVEIRSPVDGVVLKRLRESEAVVPMGEPLLEIGDPRRIEIVADLLSTDAVRVKPGAVVIVEQWGGGTPLEGRVRRVEPSGFMKISALGVEEQRVNVLVDFVDPTAAAQALGDNYRVEVRIVLWRGEDALTVPVGALFRRGESWGAFVVEAERTRLQQVTIDHRNDVSAEIVSGLSAGQPVVLHPPDTLTDGGRVVVRTAP